MKKGTKWKVTQNRYYNLEKGASKYVPLRNQGQEYREKAWFYITNLNQEFKAYSSYIDSLPQKFNKEYDHADYQKDIQNVLDFYTKWKREDMWLTKDSLKRIRKYEAREGLLPFEEVKENANQERQLKNLEIREEQYALRRAHG